ncbi:MAG TPA: PAS domain S-box protein [Actinobacteria bacterium]|nr:PAS domain S-box protein [Actinomycetota bacterium]
MNSPPVNAGEKEATVDRTARMPDYLVHVMDNIVVAAYCVDPQGEIIYANKVAHELFGFSVGELHGQNLVSLVSKGCESYTQLVDDFHVDQRPNSGNTLETTGLKRDATEFPIELMLLAQATSADMVTTWLVNDISKRKKIELTHKKNERAYRTLVETLPEAFMFMNMDLKIMVCNEFATDLLGYQSINELIGKNYLDIMSSREVKRAEANAKEILASGAVATDEYMLMKKDGTFVPAELHISTMKARAGEVRGLIVTARDITKRKQVDRQLEHRLDNLLKTQIGAVRTLSKVIGMKDQYIADHQERVTRLACAIAREMGFSEERTEEMRLVGILHDIGKLFVPIQILSKPGKLTEEEFQTIKGHVRSGYDAISVSGFPDSVIDAVRQHHERLNGSGYPDGLKEEEITEEAKILAVADVVEAMSSRRPYRAGLGEEKALEEIQENSGQLYDREVGLACVRLFHEKNFNFVKVHEDI